MKLPLHIATLTAIAAPSSAYTFTKSIHHGVKSTFTMQRNTQRQQARPSLITKRGDMLMYESPSDPPNPQIPNEGSVDMWSALASTERWIQGTLANASAGDSNPYQRKEISYVCETEENLETIVAGVFRRLKEAREMGDEHGKQQKELSAVQGSEYKVKTLRETVVVVIPSSNTLKYSFKFFDSLVKCINTARRNARDLHRASDFDEPLDWITSVNMAPLHPQYGVLTPEETLQREREEEEQGELDLNLKEYREKQMEARRSPYPTLVIEVRSSPPMMAPAPPGKMKEAVEEVDGDVTKEDLQKLEALFGKTASFDHPVENEAKDAGDDDFYASIASVDGIEEISFTNPLTKAKIWAAGNLPDFDQSTSSFTESHAQHADAAYEFVFSEIAAHRSSLNHALYSYLVMPEFCMASATSLEKFGKEVMNIVEVMPVPDLGLMDVEVLHPEHIEGEKRAPVPIVVLKWKY